MLRLLRYLSAIALVIVVVTLGLLAPVAYVETACRPQRFADSYKPILAEADRRAESRTLLTYPEWHIVHAYDDYGRVISSADPHDYQFLPAIGSFWSSLCQLSRASGDHGGFPWETKQMVYTIGVSFTAELLAKAAYEETLGRVATWIRGDTRAALDDLSAQQATEYARFLQQVPWYRWDFGKSAAQLYDAVGETFRDGERRWALGLEYKAKAAYAALIAQAVAEVGADELRLRMIVAGLTQQQLSEIPGIQVIGQRPEGTEIDTPRYRELTELIKVMALAGADFVEIAGNDDIMFTSVSDAPLATDAIYSVQRQGYGDWRHLALVKVTDLGATIRNMQSAMQVVEHVHDY